MRFLHLADLHLDTSFAGRSAQLRARLRDAGREALARAVRHALAEDVDAVLIAGDLFDGDRLSFRTEQFLLEWLQRLTEAGVTVVYATGNHDPGGPSGPASRINWPSGVTVASDPDPVQVPIHRNERLVGRVTAAGHASSRESEDLSLRFPTPPGDVPEVALLHTQVVGASQAAAHDRYAPSRLDHLRSAGFHYWALGHIHLRQVLSADPAIHYSGNVQGRHPGETGARGGLLVELTRGAAPDLRFVELGPVRWETLHLDGLEDSSTAAGLVDRVGAAWRRAREADPGLPDAEWILRVELNGPTPLYRQLRSEEDLDELARQLETTLDLLHAEVRSDGVRPPLDPAPHMERTDVLGEGLRLLERLVASDEASPSQLLGLSAEELAGTGEEGNLDEYLRGLLDGEKPSLLEALLDREAG